MAYLMSKPDRLSAIKRAKGNGGSRLAAGLSLPKRTRSEAIRRTGMLGVSPVKIKQVPTAQGLIQKRPVKKMR